MAFGDGRRSKAPTTMRAFEQAGRLMGRRLQFGGATPGLFSARRPRSAGYTVRRARGGHCVAGRAA
eukprot:6417002-Lingulodinium_polyedra.AAC.1